MQVDSISFASIEHDPYGWVQSILNRAFGNRNRLTRLLMRAEPWRIRDLLTLILAGILTPLAFALSVASWICGRGAIMQAVLSKRSPKA